MPSRTTFIQIRLCCPAFLFFSTLVLWSVSVFADDKTVVSGEQTQLSVDNVQVLDAFTEGSYSSYRNVHQMTRWSGILAQRIAEYVTKQHMPDLPPPPMWPAISTNRADPSAAPSAIQPPVFELLPVAWSIKVVNLKTSFLPQLREEVVVLVRYTPKYFSKSAFPDGTWVLAHLRNGINQHANLGDGSDSGGRWDIAVTPELLMDHGSSRLRKTANVRCYKAKPTVEQVSEFVYATDFGNNDVYAHTTVSDRMNVDVLLVVVYPEYANLANLLRDGLKPETISQRMAAYQESFRRDGIQPSP